MAHTLTFTGHGYSYCKVNNQTVTFPYTLKNGDVISFGNGSDVDRYFTVNGNTIIPETIKNSDITIVGVTEGSGPIRTLDYYITYTEVSRKSVDLTTLSGWSTLSAGTHNITIVAKAAGYVDSEPSEAVQVTKQASTNYEVVGSILRVFNAQYTQEGGNLILL